MNDAVTFENIVPFPAQEKFLNSAIKFKLFGGGMAGGKSYAIIGHVIKCCLMWPGSTWFVARYRGKDLKRTTWPILLEMLPPQLIKSYNKTDGHIVLWNNSDIFSGDLEDPNKLKSLNLTGFAIEEATDVPTADAFNMLVTRLRKKINGIKYFGLLTANPEPGWVKDLFISDLKDNYGFFPSLPTDNPHLPANYINDTMAALPPSLRARYMEGSWDAFDDVIFSPEMIMPSIDNSERYAHIVTFVDPAVDNKKLKSKGKLPDETSICTVGIEFITGIFHEIETVSGRWSHETILDNCEAVKKRILAKYATNHVFFCETNAAQDWLRQNLIREKKIACQAYPSTENKISKALSIQDLFEQRRVRINTPKLQKQLLEFPNGTHDDLADSLIMCLIQFKAMNISKPTKPETWMEKHAKKKRRSLDATSIMKQM